MTKTDYATIIGDLRHALEAGDRRSALRIARRYVDGADPELAQDLVDEADETLRAEAVAHADALEEQRRAKAYAEIAQPAAKLTHRRGPATPCRTAGDATARRAGERDADNYADLRTDPIPDQRTRDNDTSRNAEHDYTGGAAIENAAHYKFNRDTGAEAAFRGAQGKPCLMPGCGIERTPADYSNPDGLCTDCRTDGLRREDAINAKCAQQTEAACAQQRNPLDTLRQTYLRIGDGGRDQSSRKAAAHDRDAIAAWVAANLRAEIAADNADPAVIAQTARDNGEDVRAALGNAWHAAATKGRARIAQWAQDNAPECDAGPAFD